jgi:hypothetical protein
MEYKVQRPSSIWIETIVEAEDFDEALELADKAYSNGDFEELDGTWEIDYDRYWIEDENEETKEEL